MLKEKLKDKIPHELLSLLPSTYQIIGHVLIFQVKKELRPYAKLIADTFLELFPYVRTVCLREGPIWSRERKPRIIFLSGAPEFETIHKEHKCIFKLDVRKIMFSKGNLYERIRIAKLVREGEVIVDMFAGIGYFSIPIAVHSNPKIIYAIDINPLAINYLKENIKLNKVEGKIVPILGDCREVCKSLGRVANRIIMGWIFDTYKYLPSAFEVVAPAGAVIHYHFLAKKEELDRELERAKKIGETYGMKVNLIRKRKVKSYGKKIYHWVFDLRAAPEK